MSFSCCRICWCLSLLICQHCLNCCYIRKRHQTVQGQMSKRISFYIWRGE
jgi:hypothetical protein